MSSKTGITSKERRVGILGAGAMGVQHLEAWHKLGVPIGGLYARDLDRGRAAAAALRLSGLRFCRRIVKQGRDCGHIACPPFSIRRRSGRRRRRDAQIVCEKPLALTTREGEAIFRDCDAAKVRIFLAMVVRFFPVYRAVWERVRRGAWGRLNRSRSSGLFPLRRQTAPGFSTIVSPEGCCAIL